jgi:hypothetical protein
MIAECEGRSQPNQSDRGLLMLPSSLITTPLDTVACHIFPRVLVLSSSVQQSCHCVVDQGVLSNLIQLMATENKTLTPKHS